MSLLPQVPASFPQGKPKDYLIQLVRQADRELRLRPARQVDGVMYMGFDQPYIFVDEDGNQFVLGQDVLPPGLAISDLAANGGTILETAHLAENGGTIPEIDRVNNFAQMLQVGGENLIETGSNANGSWISFAGLFAVAWRVVTPDWTNASFQVWSTPFTWPAVPAQFTSMATHGGGGPGNAAIDVQQGVADSPTETAFRIAFRGGVDAVAAGEQITIVQMGAL